MPGIFNRKPEDNKTMAFRFSPFTGRAFPQFKPLQITAFLLVWLFFTTACSLSEISQSEENQFTLDPVFRIFVRNVGGSEVFGTVLSPMMEYGDKKTQFVEKGLLIYDPSSADASMVRLWPVGRELQVEEAPIDLPLTVGEGALFLNGHYIPPAFSKFFTQIGGLPVAGSPLTEVHFNPFYQRYEQFFENVGFYQLKDPKNSSVHLLSYGSWMCGENCPPGPDKAAFLDIDRPVGEPFLSLINKIGRDFTGYPINCVIETQTAAPTEIKVLKNLVMISNSDSNNSVNLFPVPEMVGIQKEEPSQQENVDRAVFIPTTADGLGYNVPISLVEYIDKHGGLGVTGHPITHFQKYGDGFRQCFENLCLLYQPNAEPWLQTQPEALGYFYIRLHPECKKSVTNLPGGSSPAEPVGNFEEINLKTWEEFPYLGPGYAQTIHVSVKDKLNRPLEGYEVELTIYVPENHRKIYLTFPPTGTSGQAQVEVPVFVLPSGTLVPYQVCFEGGGTVICQDDDYVIWENP